MRAAFTKYPTGQIIVPAGTYLIDDFRRTVCSQ